MCFSRCTLQWVSQQPIMIELCFNLLNTSILAKNIMLVVHPPKAQDRRWHVIWNSHLGVGISHVDPWFHTTLVVWNLGLTWDIPTTPHMLHFMSGIPLQQFQCLAKLMCLVCKQYDMINQIIMCGNSTRDTGNHPSRDEAMTTHTALPVEIFNSYVVLGNLPPFGQYSVTQ